MSDASSSRSPVTRLDLILDVEDPLEVERARPPHHPDHVVALFEQQFGQVRAVLPSNARDKCAPCHREVLPGDLPANTYGSVEVVGCRWGAERMTRRERLTEQVESFLEPGEHLHGAFNAQTGIPAWVWGGTGGLGGALIRVADRGLGVLLVAIAGLVLVVFASYLLGTRTWVVAGTDKRTLVFTTGRIRRRTVTGLDSEGPRQKFARRQRNNWGIGVGDRVMRVSAGEAREIETINDELTAEGDRTPPANPPRPDLRSRIITIVSVVAVHLTAFFALYAIRDADNKSESPFPVGRSCRSRPGHSRTAQRGASRRFMTATARRAHALSTNRRRHPPTRPSRPEGSRSSPAAEAPAAATDSRTRSGVSGSIGTGAFWPASSPTRSCRSN